jgi:hypothetical protein
MHFRNTLPEETMIKSNVLYVDDLQANLILFQAAFERDYNIILKTNKYEMQNIMQNVGDIHHHHYHDSIL